MTLLKEKITFGTIMGVVREYFVMTIGILLYTFAWIACILPAHGTGGGATGAALVLCGAIENLFNFQINIGTMAFIVNGILLLFAGNTARRAGVARGTGRYPTRCDQPVR